MNKSTIQSLAYTALAAGLIAAVSPLAIPLGPIPLTLQTLIIGLVATLLKPREAVGSIALYLLLGGIGLPVFSGFRGGFHILFGPTGGFLWTFLLYALIASSLLTIQSHPIRIFWVNCLGVAVTLLGGALFFSLVNHVSLWDSVTVTVLPFIWTGLLKIVLVSLAVSSLRPILSKESYWKA